MKIDFVPIYLSWKKKTALSFLLALLYLLSANIRSLFSSFHPGSTPFWFPVGVALTIALLVGVREVLPGLIIGVSLIGVFYSLPPITIFGLISAHVLEVILTTVLLRARKRNVFAFSSPKEVLEFILIAVVLSPFVASTVAISFLYMGGSVEIHSIPREWSDFFITKGLSVLLLTPLLFSFLLRGKQRKVLFEGAMANGVLLLTAIWALKGSEVRIFLLIPILTWIALRLSFQGVSISAILLGGTALVVKPELGLLWVQGLTGAIAIVGYFMATISEAQEEAQERDLAFDLNLKEKNVAEEALAILDQSLHKSPMGFALVDKNHNFIRMNERFAEIIPESAERHFPFIDHVFHTAESYMNLPFNFTTEAKKTVSGLVSYYPVRTPGTQDIFAVGVTFHDLSELIEAQNLLRENEQRLMFAQEAGRIGAFEWDLLSNHILWTPELEHIYGLSFGEFGGFYQSWLKWIHPEDLSVTSQEFQKVIDEGSELNHQFRIINKEHETRWILARGKVIKDADEKKIKLVGINIDLTEQKNIEQKLRLTEANLLHALSVRDEFLAIASHELKTPLTSLKLQMQIFQRGVEKNDPEAYSLKKIKALVENNSKQVDRVTRLVDDMLDISRIRTGKLSIQKEACDLSRILKDILLRTKPQFESSGAGHPIIEHLDEAQGEWDPLRIEQVVTNIITNSIRYGQGKPVFISIKNYNEVVRLTVRDQGLGITKSDQEKIFKRYERGLLAREVSGLGLGLFISKEIIEAHGGKIWVESEVSKGSTFLVDLPRKKNESTQDKICEGNNHESCDKLTSELASRH